MDSLSDELHCMIVSQLSESHMGAANYRLVNKRHANIGAEFMFDHFMCRPTPQCLERLRFIKQSKFKRHVKTIDFTSDTDPDSYEEEDSLGDRVTIFREIVEAFPQVLTLSGQNLRYETFAPQNYSEEFTEACTNLTYLGLGFFASEADFDTWIQGGDYLQAFQANLREVLANTTHLTILNLNFGPRSILAT